MRLEEGRGADPDEVAAALSGRGATSAVAFINKSHHFFSNLKQNGHLKKAALLFRRLCGKGWPNLKGG